MKLVDISRGKNSGAVTDYKTGRNEHVLAHNRSKILNCNPSTSRLSKSPSSRNFIQSAKNSNMIHKSGPRNKLEIKMNTLSNTRYNSPPRLQFHEVQRKEEARLISINNYKLA